MSKIRILPEILSNKIAAGEVVERPASVVKELLENALDAGSTRIMLEIQNGGRSLIRMADNGHGMSRDDALLSLERYATSKIDQDSDLFRIQTLGFRGEALPSIGAVSRLRLVTREADADVGTEIFMAGGTIRQVADAGAPPGTLVEVQHLFFNTPARRKFLKTVSTEMSHIGDTVAAAALGNPEVQIKLIHNGKPVKSWPAVDQAVDRVADVLGKDIRSGLSPAGHESGEIRIHGWAARPDIYRSTPRGIFSFVNSRFVRDRVVRHAVIDGYAQRMVRGRFPVAVIFIDLPFDQVDVNVHPAKHEVRFVRPREVHDAVQNAVAQAVSRIDQPAWTPPPVDMPPAVSPAPPVNRLQRFPQPGTIEKKVDLPNTSRGRLSSDADVDETGVTGSVSKTGVREQPVIWQKKGFSDLRVIGQLHHSYILCENPAGMILIDQHAAHERILYEAFRAADRTRRPRAQRLLVPETLELSFQEAEILQKLLPELVDNGLEIEPFGGNTFVVKALPAVLEGKPPGPMVREMLEAAAETGRTPETAGALLDRCRHIMACHGAIRANQPLETRQIQSLLAQLDACENPAHCPHGRPTWFQMSLRDLEKSFDRIV